MENGVKKLLKGALGLLAVALFTLPAFSQQALQGGVKQQVKDVQSAIRAKGAHWTAGETNISDSREDWKYLVGLNYEPVDAEPIAMEAAAELPAAQTDAIQGNLRKLAKAAASYFKKHRDEKLVVAGELFAAGVEKPAVVAGEDYETLVLESEAPALTIALPTGQKITVSLR